MSGKVICTDCVLHRGAVSNCIGGRGDGAVLLVGMAPGGEEDIAGSCFVGPSGTLLEEMLADAGYAPEDTRLTNAVRCFVPQDTSVSNDSINACRRHLQEEIRMHRPEVIIALGDVALRSLCKTSGIASKRGQPLPLHSDFDYDCTVYPTYHPAFVARILQVRPTVVADLRKVRDRTRTQEPIAYECANILGYAVDVPMAIDIETIDERGDIVDRPTQIAYAIDGASVVVSPVGGRIEAEPIVHHNGLVFDLPKLEMEPQGYDTMALAYLDDEAQPLGLEALCVRYLGVRGWKENRNGAVLGSKELQEYNARDALYTLRLYHVLRERLGERIRIYDEILLPALLALRDCTRRGIFVDKEAVRNAEMSLTEQIATLTTTMHAWPQAGSWFNPNSNGHLATVFERVGITLTRRTARSGKPQIDKAVLAAIDHPYARTVEQYRKRTKRLSTYVLPYTAIAAKGDGRVHNEYTLWRTATGRTSARRPNVQNLDRDLKFFSAEPGHVYVHADYSAMEFWLAAWYAQEQRILVHERGWDPHAAFARFFYGTDRPTREQRQVAKSANFSQLYMGSATTLQEYALKQGVHLTGPKCVRLHGAWHALYPGFRPWYARTWAFVKEHGYIETATGRRRHFGDVKRLRGRHILDAQRQAVNDLVQSLAADVALIGLSCCRKNGLPITGFFHDAVSFDFEQNEYSETTTNTIRRSLVDEPIAILREKFSVDLNVPLAVEITAKENT